MDFLQDIMARGGSLVPEYSVERMGLSMLLAFVLGQLIAWVYQRTHAGLSYSRSFTQSLVLMNMVVALVMFVIGDSIVTAFGLIGALAIIRFRNVLKDTRDTVFVFFTLVLGMAVGSQRYLAAIIGTLALLSAAIYLHFVRFGTRGLFDGHLSFRLEGGDGASTFVWVLKRFCRRYSSISVRQGGGVTEYIFQIRLRDTHRTEELIHELQGVGGIGEVSLVLQDELAEV
jgi:uncharacterized protein DUF4956